MWFRSMTGARAKRLRRFIFLCREAVPSRSAVAPTIKQVAQRAGVSAGTVSNVLNRPELVSRRTRTRVLAAIEDLGFVRNASARDLRVGRSRTIGLLVLD